MANDEMNIGYFSRSNEIMNDFVERLFKNSETAQPVIDKDSILKDFESFENLVQSSPEMKMVFAALQKKFVDDPEYTAKVDPNFVAGVMLLDISE